MNESEVVEAGGSYGGARKRFSCLFVGVLAVGLILVLAVGAWFWLNRPIKAVELSSQEVEVLEEKVSQIEGPKYEEGVKEIILTERELNGFLNANTDLGGQVKLTLGKDEVHARVEMDLDADFPVMGGKKLKAKARFLVSMVEGRPSLILDDLTAWGVSLPSDWLAGMKGKDLLGEIFGNMNGVSGIEELKVEPGRLVVRLAE